MHDVLGSLSGSALDVLKTVSSSDANELKHLKEVALLNNHNTLAGRCSGPMTQGTMESRSLSLQCQCFAGFHFSLDRW